MKQSEERVLEFAAVMVIVLAIAFGISQYMVVPILGPTIALVVFFVVFACVFMAYLLFRFSKKK